MQVWTLQDLFERHCRPGRVILGMEHLLRALLQPFLVTLDKELGVTMEWVPFLVAKGSEPTEKQQVLPKYVWHNCQSMQPRPLKETSKDIN